MDARLEQIADRLLAVSRWDAFDPAMLDSRLLRHFFVLHAERQAADIRLRIRLTGTALDTIFARPLKDRFLEDFIHGPRGGDVIAVFHRCALRGEAAWMRQVVGVAGKVPRFVEGVVVRLAPDRLCGGLVMGEVPGASVTVGFQSRPLARAPESV